MITLRGVAASFYVAVLLVVAPLLKKDSDMKHKYKDKKWLKQKYIIKNMSLKEISSLCNTTIPTIRGWLKKYNIKKPVVKINRDKLHHEYITKNMTSEQLAEKYDTSIGTINRRLKGHNLTKIKLPDCSTKEYRNKKWLTKQYIKNKLTSRQIAKMLGMEKSVILKWIKKHGIDPNPECRRLLNNPISQSDLLYKEYITNSLSSITIAKKHNTSPLYIRKQLTKYSILQRSFTESHVRGKDHYNYKHGYGSFQKECVDCGDRVRQSIRCQTCFTKYNRGTNHACYKTTTPLRRRIRGYCNDNWRFKIFIRDDRTCQHCGYFGSDINAHHIIPFIDIFNGLLDEYKDLEDNDKVNPIITDKMLNSLGNGITLCIDCHKKEHSA